MQLRDAVIIVTGASAGIGLACISQLAEAGAHVIAVARRADALAEVVAALPGQHGWYAGDITHSDTMPNVVAHAMALFGRVDGIICNAGIGLSAPVAELRWDDVVQCMHVNVGGVLSAFHAVLPLFYTQRHGTIVVISSLVGVQGLPYSGGYCATKGALERLCDAFRIELRGSPIKFSVIRPGTVDTEFFRHRMGKRGEVRRGRYRGISAQTAARAVVHAVQHHPRIGYTRWQDRIILWASLIAPQISDRVLAKMIRWNA